MTQSADMPRSAAEGHETFSPGRRRYPMRTGAPAYRGAVPFQRAGMGVPTADGPELPALGRLGLAFHIASPASGGAIEAKAADVEGVAADGCQQFSFGQRGIRVLIRCTPTRHAVVLADPAGESAAGADGNEPHALRGRGLPELVVAPANGHSVHPEGTGVVSSAADCRESFTPWRGRLSLTVIPPAYWSALLSGESASIVSARADGGKSLCGLRWRWRRDPYLVRQGRLPVIVQPPADGNIALPHPATVPGTAGYLGEALRFRNEFPHASCAARTKYPSIGAKDTKT